MLLACTVPDGTAFDAVRPGEVRLPAAGPDERELTGGNGMVEMGTFVAILLGNVAGGLMVAMPRSARAYVAVACVRWRWLGARSRSASRARRRPTRAWRSTGTRSRETWRNLKLAHGNLVVFRSLLGISWMWFFGAVFLSQFPSFAKEVLHGDEQVASLLLVVFSVGIGIGSLLCEVLSRRHVEIGLVPLGAIGMSVFAIDLYFASRGLPRAGALRRWAQFLGAAGALARDGRPGAAVAVRRPVQRADVRADPAAQPADAPGPHHRGQQHPQRAVHDRQLGHRRRAAAGRASPSRRSSCSSAWPTRWWRSTSSCWCPSTCCASSPGSLSHLVYRFKVARRREHPGRRAPAMLVCNHVSFVDAVLLMAASPRPIRFVMDHRIFKVPVLGWLFRLAKAIPIAPRKEDPAAYEAAFDAAAQVLREGDLLAIFPEGGITRDGTLQPFKGGIMKILGARAAGCRWCRWR